MKWAMIYSENRFEAFDREKTGLAAEYFYGRYAVWVYGRFNRHVEISLN